MGLHKRGQVLLWRSVKRRNYPGYQFSADVEGCDTLVAVVAELRQGRLLKRPFNLTEPSPKAFGGRLPITGNDNVLSFQTLHLSLEPELGTDLRVEEADAHIILTFSSKGLASFSRAWET